MRAIRQVHDQVFYMEFDDDDKEFVAFVNWIASNFVRDTLKGGVKTKYSDDGIEHIVQDDADFHLEDAGWPMTPPGVRLVFKTKDAADRFIAQWKDHICPWVADEHFMISDPKTILRPW